MTNCCCTTLVEGMVARDKNEGKRGRREGMDSCFCLRTTLRHSDITLRRDAAARRASYVNREGSRAVEKVDQYQAKRSAPTNLCGDPSNDTFLVAVE